MVFDDVNLEAIIRAGQAAHKQGDHVREVELWKKAATIEPKNPYWQANLAHAFFLTGNADQAAELFEYVIDTAPHVSPAYNNYAAVLVERGVPLSGLFPLFVMAVETSEDYGYFQRHLLNVCSCVALGDTAPHDSQWRAIEERAIAFLERNNDRTPEHDAFVRWAVAAYSGYEEFLAHLSVQDWEEADRKLEEMGVTFGQNPASKNEAARIEYFRPLVKGAASLLNLLNHLGGDNDVSAEAFCESCEELLSFYREYAQYAAKIGSSTFLNILGWCAAELKRQLSWFVRPGLPFDASASSVPNQAFAAFSSTRYSEIVECFHATLLQVNRIVRRTAERYSGERGKSREILLEKAWLSVRVAVHGAVGEFSGLTNVIGREMLGWNKSPRDRVRREILRFRTFVETQGYNDMYVSGSAQEAVGRSILQAFLVNNGYREVPIRGGRVDILVLRREASFVIETKIWRGKQYHEDGMIELEEYLTNNSDELEGGFYVIFDPTESGRANTYMADRDEGRPDIETIVVSIRPPIPSRKGEKQRKSQSGEQ